ncbi:MAG: hypothetical protein K6G58_05410 [Lachnospiraceae bacterium]|nr:hypothetical protein [Lachnospiraceae bacterium]
MSEIREFRDEIMSTLGQMGERFEAMDQRMDAMDRKMDRRFDELDSDVIEICNQMGKLHNETLEKFKTMEGHIKGVEILCGINRITPDIMDRVDVV